MCIRDGFGYIEVVSGSFALNLNWFYQNIQTKFDFFANFTGVYNVFCYKITLSNPLVS